MDTEVWYVTDKQGNPHTIEINPSSADDALYFLRTLRRLAPTSYDVLSTYIVRREEHA